MDILPSTLGQHCTEQFQIRLPRVTENDALLGTTIVVKRSLMPHVNSGRLWPVIHSQQER